MCQSFFTVSWSKGPTIFCKLKLHVLRQENIGLILQLNPLYHLTRNWAQRFIAALLIEFPRVIEISGCISLLTFFSRRKKKCVRFLAGGAGQDMSPSSNAGNVESENIDANIDSNTAMISSTNSSVSTT